MFIDHFQPDGRVPAELFLIPPLLALTTSLGLSLAAGLNFVILLLAVAVTVSLIRHFVAWRLRIPCLALVIATWICLLDMALLAGQYELRQQFGIYLPLLACNSLMFTSSEDAYLRLPLRRSITHAARTGLVVLSLFLVLGAARELLAYGSAGAGLQTAWPFLSLESLPDAAVVLPIVATPPGALICAGLVFAAWTHLTRSRRQELAVQTEGPRRIE